MTSNDYREPVSSALLVSAAPSMMLSADQQAFAGATYQQQMSNLALVSSPANNARRPKPTNGKLSTVKSGGVHKSKPSTSSVSSSSTMGNQRNASHSDGDNSDRSANASDSEPQEQRRRRRFLERNRVAASKCRQKKKMWVQELERRAEDVTMQNRSLHIAVAQLKEEVMILKNQLLAHRNCNCSAIHQYLQAECVSDASVAPPLMSQHAPTNPMMAPLLMPQAPQGPQSHGPIMMQQGPQPHGQMIIPPQHFRNPPVYASHAHHTSVDMAVAPTIISTTAPPAPAHAPSASPRQ
ncbi:hypothetical protein IW147_000763 [Coemansia sp. RSA 720]|nr:hypothetical protein IW147_000763 [Coemansia sp. RSA 720]